MEEYPLASALEQKLIDLEKKFWESMKAKDLDTALTLTADPVILTGAQGVSRIDKATFAKLMTGAKWTLHDFDIHDAEVEQLSDDVAVIGYKVHEDLTVDGERIALDAADASTWVRKNGNWVCALHTESVAGDPFGRDRQPGNPRR
jgi:hypothetical protein